jgi:excisionase family DNA binding protein
MHGMVPVVDEVRLLTVPQVALQLGIHPATAYRLARSGELPVAKIGGSIRVDPRRLAAWLEERQR